MMWHRACCCRAAVSASRKIRDTLCPVVPEEVRVLNTCFSGMLRSASSLNRPTGSMGASSGAPRASGVPRASSSRPYSGQRSR